MFQIFGHLYETVFLILMLTRDFPGYQAKDEGCKAACAAQSQNKKFPFQPCRCSPMAQGILRKSGKIRDAISSGQMQMMAKVV